MNGKIADCPAANRTWSGRAGCCLMFSIVFWAAIPALAKQDDAAARPRQGNAVLSNASVAPPMRLSPVEVPPAFGSPQPTIVPARVTPRTFAYSPMTRQQRWQDYKDQNLESYGAFFRAFFTGLGDDLGRVPRWDSGMTGLSEHVGSEFAAFTIGGTIHSSLAAALHQDTRYFHSSCRGAFLRTLHAVGRTIFTYGENGHLYPDVSGLAGIYAGPMIMTEWYPAKYSATGFGVRQANIAVGITSALYVIREFSPEIGRAFHRRKAGKAIPEP